VCFFHFAREAAGAAGTRHSLRPLFSKKAKRFVHNSGEFAPRECEVVSVVFLCPCFVASHPSRRGLPAAPQDEDFRCGPKSDPHGEEARRAVSNHEAQRGVKAV
jgi:hypothetical protein